MFSRKPEQEGPGKLGSNSLRSPGGPPPVPNARLRSGQSGAETPSVIGPGLTITGDLEAKGEIQIEGELQGDIHAARIIVGEQGRIRGNVVANDIIIRGNVRGLIRGNNVTMQSNSRVEGDIFHKVLSMEQGAFFEGRARRSEDPMEVQQPADEMRPRG